MAGPPPLKNFRFVQNLRGLVPSGRQVVVKTEIKVPHLGGFFMSNENAVEKLLAENPDEGITLLRLAVRVERQSCNRVIFRPGELAKALNKSKLTIERHVSKLRELGLLVPDPIEADLQRGIRIWRVNPFIVWKGTKEEKWQYLQTLPETHPFFRYLDPTSAWTPEEGVVFDESEEDAVL